MQWVHDELDTLADKLGEIHGSYIVEGLENPERFDCTVILWRGVIITEYQCSFFVM